MLFRIAVVSALALSSGCSSPKIKNSCAERDWYEIGRGDGAQGNKLDLLNDYKRACGGDLSDHNEMIYRNGRNAGLVEYCHPDSAFELGRAGRVYDHVCPETVEPSFLAAFERGRRARVVEQRAKTIDVEIENLSNRLLRAEGLTVQRQLGVELSRLRRARVRADQERDQILR